MNAVCRPAVGAGPAPVARPVGAGPRRSDRRAVHGMLLLDKPFGLSSHAALQQARRLLRAEKAGHTGTLDPLATGLLPLAFGAATKFAHAGLDADKRYRATLTLGATTASGDRETPVVETRPLTFDRERLEVACAALTGTIEQRAPMHSALKHAGRALYAYARRGIEIERESRRVRIERLDIVEWRGEHLVLDVACSKGTYLRSLAVDLGEALGCGAHLAALRRTGSGGFDVADAVTLDALQGLPEAGRDALLRAPDALLAAVPAIRLEAGEAARFLTGLRRRIDAPDAALVRVYGPEANAFLGSARLATGELIPERLLSPDEVRALIA